MHSAAASGNDDYDNDQPAHGRAAREIRLAWTKTLFNRRGFGVGVAVILDRDRNDIMRRGSPGAVSWPGAYGGWWQADPTEGSVQIFLAHNTVDLEQMAKGVGLGVWAALESFQTLVQADR